VAERDEQRMLLEGRTADLDRCRTELAAEIRPAAERVVAPPARSAPKQPPRCLGRGHPAPPSRSPHHPGSERLRTGEPPVRRRPTRSEKIAGHRDFRDSGAS